MKTLNVNENNSIAFVTLNRPNSRNAFNPEMIKEITHCFKKFSKRKDLRAIILSGAGKCFCAGADLHWMKETTKNSAAKNKKDANELFEMFNTIFNCPIPLITTIHGAAIGGGLGLIACSDIVIAEEKTQLCFSEVKLGLVPSIISHFVLKKATLGNIAPWMLLGRFFSAKEAQFFGLVHIVVDQTQLVETRDTLVNQLLAAGPQAVQETKKLIHKIKKLSDVKAKQEVVKVISNRRASVEAQEGMQSFFDKKSPSWKQNL